MKFIINRVSEFISLSALLICLFLLLKFLSIPIDFIESRYKENRVYQNMTAKLNVVSSTLFNSMGCVLVPALCNEVNRVKKEINRYDRRKKSNIGLTKCLIRPPLADPRPGSW